MCTVTIIPKGKNDFILTSNRDEAPNRVSLSPEIYNINGTKLLFPKDVISGGTWIGVSEKNRLVCVLNGGFSLHKRQTSYRLSRGIVANDFLTSENILETIESYNLEGIEPFTMVIADWNISLKFYELVWDNDKKYFTELLLESRVWSSTTLYNSVMKQERQDWFRVFKEEEVLNAKSILKFHKTAGEYNTDYGVIMDRGFVKTTSITQVEKTGDFIEMVYENLLNKTKTLNQFNLPSIVND